MLKHTYFFQMIPVLVLNSRHSGGEGEGEKWNRHQAGLPQQEQTQAGGRRCSQASPPGAGVALPEPRVTVSSMPLHLGCKAAAAG